MDFTPEFDGYQEKVSASFKRQGFMKLINASLLTIAPGYCEIEVCYDPNLSQQHGYFHAGVIGTIADNAAGYAGFSLMAENSSVLTIEYKLNLLAPAKGDKLIGKGQVLKKGRTLTICRSEIYIVKDEIETLCAASQASLIELRDTFDSPIK